MGFLSSIVKIGAPIIGGMIGGPAGAAIGSAVGGFAGGQKLGAQAGTAMGQYMEDRDTRAYNQRTLSNNRNIENIYQQQADARADQRQQKTFAQQKAMGDIANAQRIAQAQKQMDFQERMSNTSHQREIKDLAAAGLNPILSSKYGGSSTPGGAMAQIADSHTPAMASANAQRSHDIAMRKLSQDFRMQENNIRLQEQQIKKAQQDVRSGAQSVITQQKNNALIPKKGELLRQQANQAMYGALERSTASNLNQMRTELAQESSAKTVLEQRKIKQNIFMDQLRTAGLINERDFNQQTGEFAKWARFIREMIK